MDKKNERNVFGLTEYSADLMAFVVTILRSWSKDLGSDTTCSDLIALSFISNKPLPKNFAKIYSSCN